MILRILGASIVALCLGFYAEHSHAGQTFICADGRLLQLEAKDVARMKRSDPCVASHFGLTVAQVPLPVKRPARVPRRGLAGAAEFKGPQQAAAGEREIGAMAQVSTDFRRVRIINARSGGAAWFNHTR